MISGHQQIEIAVTIKIAVGQAAADFRLAEAAANFSSYIVKSTLDNPGNKTVKQYMRDPILSLLEGDNIKDRIFNYEQDLWSY